MTLSEKLRFIADRMEDEKEFYINEYLYTYQNGGLMRVLNETDCNFMESALSLDTVLRRDLKLKPQWEFTEDEKVILRNLPDEFQWIARDEADNGLYAYTLKTTKSIKHWLSGTDEIISLNGFNHLFQCIKWSDDEPCEFRRYL